MRALKKSYPDKSTVNVEIRKHLWCFFVIIEVSNSGGEIYVRATTEVNT